MRLPRRMVATGLVLAALTLSGSMLAACGGDDNDTSTTTDTEPGNGPSITIEDFEYSSLTAEVGERVTVVNKDNVAHTVTEVNRKFDSGNVGADKTGSFTAPAEPGTYSIYCIPHPFMKAKITVT